MTSTHVHGVGPRGDLNRMTMPVTADLYYLPALVMAGGAAAGLAAGVAPSLVSGGMTLMACGLCIASIGCLSHQSTAGTGTCWNHMF